MAPKTLLENTNNQVKTDFQMTGGSVLRYQKLKKAHGYKYDCDYAKILEWGLFNEVGKQQRTEQEEFIPRSAKTILYDENEINL